MLTAANIFSSGFHIYQAEIGPRSTGLALEQVQQR